MNVSYKRDLNHNYMIMTCEEEHIHGYEMKMLTENEVSGFLPLSIRSVDGETMIYYEISSRQSMKRIFQHTEMGYEDLHALLFQFHKMFRVAEEYLMNVDCILLAPDYLYMNIDTKEIAVCYYPDNHLNAKEAFQKWMEYVLERVNHEDTKAVMLAYRIYKNTRNINFVFEELLDLTVDSGEESHDKQQTAGIELMREKDCSVPEKEDLFGKERIRDYREREKKIEKEERNFKIDGEGGRKKNKEEKNKEVKEAEYTGKGDDKEIETPERKSKPGKKKQNRMLLFSFLLVTGLVYLKGMNLLPEGITYHQYLISLGVGGMSMAGCIIKIIIDQAKKKLEKEEEEGEKEGYEAWSKLEIENRDHFDRENVQEEESVKLYDFLTGDSQGAYMVAEENVYTLNSATESQGFTEEEYLGNTMLLGSYIKEEQRELTGIIKGKSITYSLKKLPVTIGKKADYVDIAIQDSAISRMHARFFEKDENVYLEDLNSTNGTFKNHVRLEANETVKVEPKDEIAFAKIVFTYH